MKAKLELTEEDLKELILTSIQAHLGETKLNTACLKIEVKSKQNYKSERETAAFRAIYDGEI